MRRLRAVSLVLTTALLLGGCAHKNPDAITVDISVQDYDAASLVVVRDNLARWENANPDIEVVERDRIRNDDYYSLGKMGADHLPDVFITNSQIGRLLVEEGLVVDLSLVAPDVSSFTFDGRVFAFPVLRESMSVVVYDPDSWDGTSVAYEAGDRSTMINCYVGSALADDEGSEWFSHMIAGDMEASFTDDLFIDRLDEARDLMSDDTAYSSRDDLFSAFISGECSAVTVCGDALFGLMEQLQSDNPDLYGRVEFTSVGRGVPSGYQYGVFIRVGMNEERTLECVDLARSIASGSDVWESDPTVERLLGLQAGEADSYVPTQYLIAWFWNYASDECFLSLPDGNKTSEEYAHILQNYYEMYYI